MDFSFFLFFHRDSPCTRDAGDFGKNRAMRRNLFGKKVSTFFRIFPGVHPAPVTPDFPVFQF
jgi:hypothetical protein